MVNADGVKCQTKQKAKKKKNILFTPEMKDKIVADIIKLLKMWLLARFSTRQQIIEKNPKMKLSKYSPIKPCVYNSSVVWPVRMQEKIHAAHVYQSTLLQNCIFFYFSCVLALIVGCLLWNYPWHNFPFACHFPCHFIWFRDQMSQGFLVVNDGVGCDPQSPVSCVAWTENDCKTPDHKTASHLVWTA